MRIVTANVICAKNAAKCAKSGIDAEPDVMAESLPIFFCKTSTLRYQ